MSHRRPLLYKKKNLDDEQNESKRNKSSFLGFPEDEINDSDLIHNKYITIKVSRQRYNGRAAIAVYFTNVTKKMMGKLSKMQLRERRQEFI